MRDACFLLLSLALSACATPTSSTRDEGPVQPALSDSGTASPDSVDSGEPSPFEGGPSDLLRAAAGGICDALLRCCDESSQAWYFQNWRESTLVVDRVGDMPPNTALTPETCPELVETLMERTWMGGWVEAAQAATVSIDGVGAGACLDELEQAACGAELRQALTDSTCFAIAAPSGGDEQRRFIQRTGLLGDRCEPVADGFGGLYYGTCSPTEAFCCIDDGTGACRPYPTLDATGTCRAVTEDGETCSVDGPLQLCKTGSSCISGVCTRESTTPIDVGDVCYESSTYTVLGDCSDSWCDVFGSGQCEPLKGEGDACLSGDECGTGWCDAVERVCEANPVCNG